MSYWDLPPPQYNPNSKLGELDKIDMDKLSLDPDNSQEKLLQVTDSLILPPPSEKEKETTAQKKTDIGTDNNQQEGEECKE